jgi:hypothetical protein
MTCLSVGMILLERISSVIFQDVARTIPVAAPGFFIWGDQLRGTEWQYREAVGRAPSVRESRCRREGLADYRGAGERRELSQRGPGRTPAANNFLCILGLKNVAGSILNIIFLQPDSSQFVCFHLIKQPCDDIKNNPNPPIPFTSCFLFFSWFVYFTLRCPYIVSFNAFLYTENEDRLYVCTSCFFCMRVLSKSRRFVTQLRV